jgi:restriction system protein
MTAWLIRAGRRGEREQFALAKNVAVIGWSAIGDLSRFADREELSTELLRCYPGSSKARIANWTGQLWRFANEMQVGDHVVMPLKSRGQQIALGKITGPYRYDQDSHAESRHQRPVQWRSTHIPRTAVRQDLLDSMGAAMTVCELSRFDAAARVERLFCDEVDPGDSERNQDLHAIGNSRDLLAEAAARGADDPLRLTVRELIEAWGETRRTTEVVAKIEQDLGGEGLTTNPPFTEGWIDGRIALVAAGAEPDLNSTAAEEAEPDAVDVSEFPETTHRIDALRAANFEVARVRMDDSVRAATTQMMLKGYSQLAVVDDDENLRGCVSWESIAQALLRNPEATVADALVKVRPVQGHEELLSLIDEISTRGYVFVVNNRGGLKGIVTAADLAGQFGAQMQPFALLEEIERRLRQRTAASFTKEEIRTHGKRLQRKPKSAEEFNFGSYQHFYADQECFKRLGWPLDHQVFLKELDQARETRNELMHFALDEVDPAKLRQLNGLLNLIRGVDL